MLHATLTFNMDRGPNVVRIISETARAAAMLLNCACLPVWRCCLLSAVLNFTWKKVTRDAEFNETRDYCAVCFFVFLKTAKI